MSVIYSSPSNRKYYRNDDNTGTVMCWFDGTKHNTTVILDSKYRKYDCQSSDDTLVDGLPTYHQPSKMISDLNDGTAQYIKPAFCSQSQAKLFTDNFLNRTAVFNDFYSIDYTSNLLCQSTGNTAARYCKSIDACLPSIDILIRIYCDGEFIDSLDPTASQYPLYNLTINTRQFLSNKQCIFGQSCNQYDSLHAQCLLINGMTFQALKSKRKGLIIPVKVY